jgi:ABC-type transport system substrate-binding protein
MKNFYRILALTLVVAMVLTAGFIIAAQDEVGPGEGGVVIRGNTRGSANLGSLIPIRCSGVDCSDVNALMWPSFLALDPATQNYLPDVAGQGQIVNGWEIADDGVTYTYTLREDAFWNDGTQITALDVYFSWLATRQGEAIGLSSSYAAVPQDILAAEIIDDFTIEFTFARKIVLHSPPSVALLHYQHMPLVSILITQMVMTGHPSLIIHMTMNLK